MCKAQENNHRREESQGAQDPIRHPRTGQGHRQAGAPPAHRPAFRELTKGKPTATQTRDPAPCVFLTSILIKQIHRRFTRHQLIPQETGPHAVKTGTKQPCRYRTDVVVPHRPQERLQLLPQQRCHPLSQHHLLAGRPVLQPQHGNSVRSDSHPQSRKAPPVRWRHRPCQVLRLRDEPGGQRSTINFLTRRTSPGPTSSVPSTTPSTGTNGPSRKKTDQHISPDPDALTHAAPGHSHHPGPATMNALPKPATSTIHSQQGDSKSHAQENPKTIRPPNTRRPLPL